MLNRNITAADVQAWMTVDELFPAGFPLEQFSMDSAVVADTIQEVETRMTLDGKLVAGYTPAPKNVNFTVEPSSPTIPYLRELAQAQRAGTRTYEVNLAIQVPSQNRKYRFVHGYLVGAQPMPSVQKTLAPMQFNFQFEGVE